MEEKVVVEFINDMKQTHVDLEIPLEITANDLVLALNEAYGLEMDTENIFSCYLVAENPIAFLRGNKTLKKVSGFNRNSQDEVVPSLTFSTPAAISNSLYTVLLLTIILY